MTEHWLPVIGYEGLYEVSDQGRVKSLGLIA
jgi:NUMOD4 motif